MAKTITKIYVEEICKIGQGKACCRYLLMVAGRGGFSCGKLDPEFKATLDARVAAKTINAQGDNCAGNESPFTEEDKEKQVVVISKKDLDKIIYGNHKH